MSSSHGVRWLAILVGAVLLGACEGPDVDTDPPEPECGNGLVEEGEQCDDADDDDGDLCLATCVLATCGDGEVFAGFEECDDGAANADTAACRADCTLQTCGDGDVGPGEACDDGNDVDTDACRNDCTVAGCGDGVKSPTEECDDDNLVDGDGCTMGCFVEPGWVCDGPCACAPGYTGEDCATCATGYQDADNDGSCEQDCALFQALEGCDLSVSYCAIDEGLATCTCYDGLFDQGAGCAPPPICRVYVAPGGSGDGSGSSWANARTSLQGAIDVAAGLAEGTLDSRCEVWAAEGRYVVYGTNPTDTLLLRTGVVVRGGFAGTETTLAERPIDPVTGFLEHDSVLDGLGACTHVVTGASGATLDGFVVTRGNASGFRGTPTGMGGGLYAIDADDLVVSNTTFHANNAKSGGALAIDGGSATLEDVRFVDNVAHWDGGAVYAVDYDSFDIVDAWFGQNHNVDGWGGAVYSFGPGLLTVDGTTFVDNASRWDAGALFHAGSGAVTFVSSRFADNNSTVWMGCLGGGAFVRGIEQIDVDAGRATAVASLGVFTAVYTDFVGNRVPFEGGGLYLKDVGYVSLIGGEFKGNVAARYDSGDTLQPGGIGGGLVGYDLGIVDVTGTSFVGNEAGWKGGGAAILEAASIALDGVTFDANEALTAEGGALVATGVVGDVVLREAVFTDNASMTTGGAVHLDGFAHLGVHGGAFLDNGTDSWNAGGALFVHGDLAASSVAIDGTVFDDNESNSVGSAFAGSYLDDVEIRRASFRRNGDGGSVNAGVPAFLKWTRTVRVVDTDFEDNATGRQWGPGALYIVAFEDVTIDGSTFVGSAPDSLNSTNGAVMLCNDSSTKYSSSFGQCSAPSWNFEDPDAGIDFEATVTVSDSTFLDNGGAHHGSHLTARYVDAITIDGSSFQGGFNEYGAGVFIEESGAVGVRDTSFADERGRYTGSGLVVRTGNRNPAIPRSLVLDGVTFRDTKVAPSLRVENIDDVTLRDCAFEGQPITAAATCTSQPNWSNQGEYMGGAAHVSYFSSIVVEDSSFESYEAYAGGALGLDNGDADATVAIRRTSFVETQSAYAGGALHVRNGATLDLEDLTFTDNRALCGAGGALHAEYFDSVTLTGSWFEDYGSRNDSGAAHITNNNTVTVQDVTFTQSKGTTSVGGALLIEYGKSGSMDEIILDGLTVEASAGGSTGGGVKIYSVGSVIVTDSTFSANTCDRGLGTFGTGWCLGSGLYVGSAGDLVVERSAFLDNSATSDGVDEGQVGAGLAADGVHTLTVRSSVFAGNLVATNGTTPAANRGAAIEFRPQVWQSRVDPLAFTVQGSTLVDNSALFAPAVSIDRVHIGDGPAIDTQVINTIARDATTAPIVVFSQDSAVPHGVPVAVSYSNVSGITGGTLNLDVDPGFRAPSVTDPWAEWRLAVASPMIGAGLFVVADGVDLEGRARANPPSMGALEFTP